MCTWSRRSTKCFIAIAFFFKTQRRTLPYCCSCLRAASVRCIPISHRPPLFFATKTVELVYEDNKLTWHLRCELCFTDHTEQNPYQALWVPQTRLRECSNRSDGAVGCALNPVNSSTKAYPIADTLPKGKGDASRRHWRDSPSAEKPYDQRSVQDLVTCRDRR